METQSPTPNTKNTFSTRYQVHRKQRFWQIIVPVGLGVLLSIVLLTMVILSTYDVRAGDNGASQWKDISLIWLSLPMVIFELVIFTILAVLVYFSTHIIKILPGYTFSAQNYVNFGAEYIKIFSNKLARPIISVKGFGTALTVLFSKVFCIRRK